MTTKAKIKSIIRRTGWAIEYIKKCGLTKQQAYQLAKIREQHTVAAKRFVKAYDAPVETDVMMTNDKQTVYVISFVSNK